MEVKIKEQDKLVDATIEMVDGVMVVSPKEVKVDVSKFTTGDILVCGWKTSEKACEWICILDGRVEEQSHIQFFLEDFCGMYTKGYNGDKEIWLDHSFSDSATYIRFATEEEKKKLFDKLAEEGWEWKPDTKELIKLKWKPKDGELMYTAGFTVYGNARFIVFTETCYNEFEQCRRMQELGWCFKTEAECRAFCDKLNEAINQVKP